MIQIECLGTRDSRLRLSVFDRPAMKSHVLLYGSEEGARDFEETEANRMSLVSLGQDLCVRWILQLLMGEGLVAAN